MKREFIVVIDTLNNNEPELAHALLRLGFYMIKDNEEHPTVIMQYKDQIDHEKDIED